jgi:DNA helicase II / ATP-dependent DNA helicase PcrA
MASSPPRKRTTTPKIPAVALTPEECQEKVVGLENGLNPAQREAFYFDKGAALVLAGAGSGKTTVLTRRVARLILSGVPAPKILVTTFTKRASVEMTERLEKILGPELMEGLWIGTFHSHCLRILKKEWAELYGKEGKFDLADESWQKRVCRAILGKPTDYEKCPHPPFGQNMRMDPKGALLAVSAGKNIGSNAENAATTLLRLYPDWDELTIENYAKFWRCYEMAKQKEMDVFSRTPARRLDFDDLLIEAAILLRDNPDICRRYQQQFDYLLVDETQDTSEVQWLLACLLGRGHGNLFAVGDVGQSVYGFRGCDPKATVMGFQKEFPKGDILRLPANYRSQAKIVTVANELIAHAELDDRYRLLMEAKQPDGPDPILSQHVDAESESARVVEHLQGLLRNTPGMQFKDAAILYRTNAYSRAIEDALIASGIPYQIFGGTGFYNRKEVKDLLAYLQLSTNPYCPAGDEALKRVLNIGSKKWGKPTRFLGRGFTDKLAVLAEGWDNCSLYEALKRGSFSTNQDLAVRDFRQQIRDINEAGDSATARLMAARQTGYDDYILSEEGDSEDEGEGSSRSENLDELIAVAGKFLAPEGMLAFIAGQVRKANESSRSLDAVNVMTIHRSKGLEWTAVFVVGFAMNLLPHHRSIRYMDSIIIPESIEEERRLAYVAITRPKDRLYLSWPQYHNARILGMSPFLAEMPTLAASMQEALTSLPEEPKVAIDEDDPASRYADL